MDLTFSLTNLYNTWLSLKVWDWPDKKCQKKTIEVDSKMMDLAVDELSKLIIRLDNNPKKTRKDQNTIKKIEEIRETIQDSVLYAKLKKSVDE